MWPELRFPPINLWSLPTQTIRYRVRPTPRKPKDLRVPNRRAMERILNAH